MVVLILLTMFFIFHKSCKTQPNVTSCLLQKPSPAPILSTELGIFLLAPRAVSILLSQLWLHCARNFTLLSEAGQGVGQGQGQGLAYNTVAYAQRGEDMLKEFE